MQLKRQRRKTHLVPTFLLSPLDRFRPFFLMIGPKVGKKKGKEESLGKRLRDGWILDPFTAIRLYLLPTSSFQGSLLFLSAANIFSFRGFFRSRLRKKKRDPVKSPSIDSDIFPLLRPQVSLRKDRAGGWRCRNQGPLEVFLGGQWFFHDYGRQWERKLPRRTGRPWLPFPLLRLVSWKSRVLSSSPTLGTECWDLTAIDKHTSTQLSFH